MSATAWVAMSVAGYVAVMVGCWIKIAADYRYNMIRDLHGGRWQLTELRNDARKDRAIWHSLWAIVWPTMLPFAAWRYMFNLAGRLGEHRAAREDATIDALKDEALALEKTRDLFGEGTDEWRLLNSVASEAHARWQEAQP